MSLRPLLIIMVAGALAFGSAVALAGLGGDYRVRFVMPSAAQLLAGSPVWVDGRQVGSVSELDVQDDKAIITATIADEHAPLHDGTTTRVEWKTVLGERVVTIHPGPAENPELPDGALYEAESTQIEVDQVLAALDQPTRERVNELLAGLRGTTAGREQDIQASLRTAGPAVEALGEVLAAVGRDGPAIRNLVTETHELVGGLAERQERVAGTVDNLTALTGNLAAQADPLREGLGELPATLNTVADTLNEVPPAATAATALFEDLQPAFARLPGLSAKLSPVLTELRPTIRELRPMLAATEELLAYTPEFIDVGHETLPPTTELLDGIGPAVTFLRPYTPEFVGWFHNWGQDFAGHDADGHMWNVGLTAGMLNNNDLPSDVVNNPALPPGAGVHVEYRPAPGYVVDQPWNAANEDANGSEMR